MSAAAFAAKVFLIDVPADPGSLTLFSAAAFVRNSTSIKQAFTG